MDYSLSQVNDSGHNIDKAKLSSDQAISLIDSLKGSSLLSSVTNEMGNFSLSGVNKSNTTNAKIALSNDSAKNDSLVVIDKHVTADKNHSKTSTIPNTNNDITKGNAETVQPLLDTFLILCLSNQKIIFLFIVLCHLKFLTVLF